MRNKEFRLAVGDNDSIAAAIPNNAERNLFPVSDREFLSWQNLQRLGCAHTEVQSFIHAAAITYLGSGFLKAVQKPNSGSCKEKCASKAMGSASKFSSHFLICPLLSVASRTKRE